MVGEMAKEKTTNSIVTINRSTGETFKLDGNEIKPYELGSSKGKDLFVTYIPYKDLNTTVVEIPRNTEEFEISNAIAVKTYDDLSLDSEKDYKITYLESTGGAGDERYYNVFVTDNELLTADLSYIANQTNYIDYVAIAPFLPEALYKRNLLAPDSVDCFIYLQKDDAFLSVYQNGEYLESRQMRYSLKYFNDKFSELNGDKIDDSTFYDMLVTNGLNLDNPIEREHIIQLFDDMFFYLGDVIASINKIRGTKIQNIYFSTDIGYISGVEEFIKERLNLAQKSFDFSIALNSKDIRNLTQLDILMMLTGQYYAANKNDDFNYSPFRRPPPLSQRPSGKLINFIIGGLVLGSVVPVGFYGYGKFIEMQADSTEAEYKVINEEVTNLEKRVEEIQNEIKNTIELSKQEDQDLTKKEGLLYAIYNKKVKYPLKSVAIYKLSDFVNEKIGKLQRIHIADNNLTFSITTDTDKKMTELIKNISKEPGYSVDTKSISMDDKNQTITYESNVSVRIYQ